MLVGSKCFARSSTQSSSLFLKNLGTALCPDKSSREKKSSMGYTKTRLQDTVATFFIQPSGAVRRWVPQPLARRGWVMARTKANLEELWQLWPCRDRPQSPTISSLFSSKRRRDGGLEYARWAYSPSTTAAVAACTSSSLKMVVENQESGFALLFWKVFTWISWMGAEILSLTNQWMWFD